jgi:antitoxin ParD1/3/4
MKKKLNISLPRNLGAWVAAQVKQGDYATESDYIRQLVREERQRQARLCIEEKLGEGLESGEPETVTAATWTESEKRVARRLKTAATKRRKNAKNY